MSQKTICIKLNEREKKLLSISIRSPDFILQKYYLQIINDKNEPNILSSETKETLIPTFQLDVKNRPITFYINHSNKTEFKIQLLGANKDPVYEFIFSLSQLVFLQGGLSKTKVYYFPFVLFEFTNGFYTTKECFENNRGFIRQQNQLNLRRSSTLKNLISSFSKNAPEEQNSNINTNTSLNINDQKNEENQSLITQSKKDEGTIGSINNVEEESLNINIVTNTLSNINTNSKSISESFTNNSVLIPNKSNIAQNNIVEGLHNSKSFNIVSSQDDREECYDAKVEDFAYYYMDYQKLPSLDDLNEDKLTPEEYTKFTNKLNEIVKENDHTESYKNLIKINRIKNEKVRMIERYDILCTCIESIKKLVNYKTQFLKVAMNTTAITRQNQEEKIMKYKKNYAKLNKLDIILNSLNNKKLMEAGYIFFNESLSSLYFFPIFKDPANVFERFQSYESKCKEYASCMGNIAMLLNYFSKNFDITLRFPLYLCGSKSYCAVNKALNYSLYPEQSKNEGHPKFEKAMKYLRENIREVINYLSRNRDILSYKSFNHFNFMYNDRNFFDTFQFLNHIFYNFFMQVRNYDVFKSCY